MAHFDDRQWEYLGQKMLCEAFRIAAEKIADKIVEERFAEIAAKMDPTAIANLSISEAAVKINETLQKKLPDRVDRIVERPTKVYQRGIFGGIRKL